MTCNLFQLYTIVLSGITQGLALKRNYYHITQSLTDIHEKSIAWLGAPKAVAALWRQFWKWKSVRLEILMIVAYLGGMLVLQAQAPGLVEEVGYTVNGTASNALTQVEWLWNSSVPRQLYASMYLFDNQSTADVPCRLKRSLPIIGILPLDLETGQIGLVNSTIYDVPVLDDWVGSGSVPINATEFFVNCQSLPDLQQSGAVNSGSANGAGTVVYPFSVVGGFNPVQVPAGKWPVGIWHAIPAF